MGGPGPARAESQYNMQSLQSKRSMSTLPFVGEMGEDRQRRDSALPAPLLDQCESTLSDATHLKEC